MRGPALTGREKVLFAALAALLLFSAWQESQIADLQERMMHIEASRYDDQLNDIRWEAETALRKTKDHDETLYRLDKHSADLRFRTMELEWDVYGKE